MRRKVANILFGILLICGGVLYGLSLFGVINYNFSLDGWWTLFIIIPCVISIISDGFSGFNTVGLGLGILFLLTEQNVIPNDIGYKLVIPLIVVIIGVKLIFKRTYNIPSEFKQMNGVHSDKKYNAVFGGSTPNYSGQIFTGCDCNAVFGGVDLLLQNAIISENCIINSVSVFGGSDIKLPSNVKVVIKDTSIFGGVDNKFNSSADPNAPTVLINAVCIFGGLDVK